jgi:hypothetical protein
MHFPLQSNQQLIHDPFIGQIYSRYSSPSSIKIISPLDGYIYMRPVQEGSDDWVLIFEISNPTSISSLPGWKPPIPTEMEFKGFSVNDASRLAEAVYTWVGQVSGSSNEYNAPIITEREDGTTFIQRQRLHIERIEDILNMWRGGELIAKRVSEAELIIELQPPHHLDISLLRKITESSVAGTGIDSVTYWFDFHEYFRRFAAFEMLGSVRGSDLPFGSQISTDFSAPFNVIVSHSAINSSTPPITITGGFQNVNLRIPQTTSISIPFDVMHVNVSDGQETALSTTIDSSISTPQVFIAIDSRTEEHISPTENPIRVPMGVLRYPVEELGDVDRAMVIKSRGDSVVTVRFIVSRRKLEMLEALINRFTGELASYFSWLSQTMDDSGISNEQALHLYTMIRDILAEIDNRDSRIANRIRSGLNRKYVEFSRQSESKRRSLDQFASDLFDYLYRADLWQEVSAEPTEANFEIIIRAQHAVASSYQGQERLQELAARVDSNQATAEEVSAISILKNTRSINRVAYNILIEFARRAFESEIKNIIKNSLNTDSAVAQIDSHLAANQVRLGRFGLRYEPSLNGMEGRLVSDQHLANIPLQIIIFLNNKFFGFIYLYISIKGVFEGIANNDWVNYSRNMANTGSTALQIMSYLNRVDNPHGLRVMLGRVSQLEWLSFTQRVEASPIIYRRLIERHLLNLTQLSAASNFLGGIASAFDFFKNLRSVSELSQRGDNDAALSHTIVAIGASFMAMGGFISAFGLLSTVSTAGLASPIAVAGVLVYTPGLVIYLIGLMASALTTDHDSIQLHFSNTMFGNHYSANLRDSDILKYQSWFGNVNRQISDTYTLLLPLEGRLRSREGNIIIELLPKQNNHHLRVFCDIKFASGSHRFVDASVEMDRLPEFDYPLETQITLDTKMSVFRVAPNTGDIRVEIQITERGIHIQDISHVEATVFFAPTPTVTSDIPEHSPYCTRTIITRSSG